MRREGKQHGLVRTHVILPWAVNSPRSNSRVVNKLEGPPTAGAFTRVSSKPTNHSKFTGSNGCSRDKPKPKNKSNGPKKLGPRSDGFDEVLNGPRFGNGNKVSAHDDELWCHENEEILEDEVMNGRISDCDADGCSDWLLV
ncbi:uncharacterized protein A4U43_C09F2010 [Asparagus officinalis]|uniref:Uncharacterized protein n=1 Tax=Asparagus officinalis TaxID=4686 RepID=A0A5P1E9E9_ASPOF|nr:uncharacterized protein LOC109823912 [Asparagus officinalis]ONK57586.1 uncharacterized protein A4U43_C09F2010 [Asparagus officinalis]